MSLHSGIAVAPLRTHSDWLHASYLHVRRADLQDRPGFQDDAGELNPGWEEGGGRL